MGAFSQCRALLFNSVTLGLSHILALHSIIDKPTDLSVNSWFAQPRSASPFKFMPACHLKPADKKAFIGDVGKRLVGTYGKKKYYEPSQVKKAATDCGYPIDIHCWAYCFYSSPDAFSALHQAAGEACDYVAMKTELLTDLASGSSFSLLDVDLSWLEWPDIDLSSIFDWFDFS